MIQGFLMTRGKEFHFLKDIHSKGVKNSLDNCMKVLAKQGYIQPRNKAIPITHKEEEFFGRKEFLEIKVQKFWSIHWYIS